MRGVLVLVVKFFDLAQPHLTSIVHNLLQFFYKIFFEYIKLLIQG